MGNAASGPITITLPAASNTGMIVVIKKIDSSLNAVKVSAAGTDKIKGLSSVSLFVEFGNLTLVAGGNGMWYIISNVI